MIGVDKSGQIIANIISELLNNQSYAIENLLFKYHHSRYDDQ